nr:MAG TPA: hypothetical protein [Caudoviricetes sp.]
MVDIQRPLLLPNHSKSSLDSGLFGYVFSHFRTARLTSAFSDADTNVFGFSSLFKPQLHRSFSDTRPFFGVFFVRRLYPVCLCFRVHIRCKHKVFINRMELCALALAPSHVLDIHRVASHFVYHDLTCVQICSLIAGIDDLVTVDTGEIGECPGERRYIRRRVLERLCSNDGFSSGASRFELAPFDSLDLERDFHFPPTCQ